MGRWAQRSRSGGGGRPTALLTYMTAVTLTAFTQEGTITWNKTVNVAALEPSDFIAMPGEQIAESLVQNGVDGAIVSYDSDVTADSQVVYSGNDTNFLSPQTVHV